MKTNQNRKSLQFAMAKFITNYRSIGSPLQKDLQEHPAEDDVHSPPCHEEHPRHVKSLFPTTSPRRFNSENLICSPKVQVLNKTPSMASIPLFLSASKPAPKSQTPVKPPIRQSDPLSSPVIQSHSKVAQRTPARPPEQSGSLFGCHFDNYSELIVLSPMI